MVNHTFTLTNVPKMFNEIGVGWLWCPIYYDDDIWSYSFDVIFQFNKASISVKLYEDLKNKW